MIRGVTLALAGLLLAAAPGGVSGLIRELGDEDVEVREKATEELARLGLQAREALIKATFHSDAEIVGRARLLLDRLILDVRLPLDDEGSVPASRINEIEITMQQVYPGEWVYLKAGLTMEVELLELDPQERLEVPRRFGCGRRCLLISSGCKLRTGDFAALRPGEELKAGFESLRQRSVRLPRPLADQGCVLATPDRAGRYRITVRYHCDPRAYVAHCERCLDHGDPDQPWNRAAARSLEKSVEFRVRNDWDPR